MRLFPLLALSALLAAAPVFSLRAIDVSPSRESVPDKDTSSGRGRFSIFSGDPGRIQKANSIDFKDFVPVLSLSPAETRISAHKDDPSDMNSLRVSFLVKNVGKRTYTLSFPNSQRYDIAIKNPAGQLVYQWSLDKKFVDEVGVVMINPTDQIGYGDAVSLRELYAPLEPGSYTVEVSLANYPEITSKAVLKVSP